jgi:hypothetical protein
LDDRPRSESADTQKRLREEIDNPIERLRLLSGDDDEIAKYLDALEVTSPREREMMQEISRTKPLAQPELFPEAHRNVVEALESLARHGYHGASSKSRIGPLRAVVRWGIEPGCPVRRRLARRGPPRRAAHQLAGARGGRIGSRSGGCPASI